MMFRAILVVLAAALFSGCATVNKQAFNRDAAASLQTLVVTQPPNQKEYEAAVIGHAGASFGLIGGLIAAADIAAKTSRFTKAIDPEETRLQERFAQKLSEELNAVGYQTALMPIAKDAKDTQVLDQARALPGKQAVLHTELIGGYWAAGHSSNYVPRVVMKARLLELRTGQVLFEDVFTYGYSSPGWKTIHAAADARFAWANIDELAGAAPEARQGLIEGIQLLAKQIAADLKKP